MRLGKILIIICLYLGMYVYIHYIIKYKITYLLTNFGINDDDDNKVLGNRYIKMLNHDRCGKYEINIISTYTIPTAIDIIMLMAVIIKSKNNMVSVLYHQIILNIVKKYIHSVSTAIMFVIMYFIFEDQLIDNFFA